jgi:dolichol-phosphate mannosyltransferase
MDADFSHSPRYLPQMLGVLLATEADVVIGSRYVPGGSLDAGWEWSRRLLSWWANLYSRAILGLRIRDMTAGFKMWRRAALQDIGLPTIRSNGYSFQVEMAYLCERLGFRLVEIPIHFEDRRIGQSKLDVPVKLESAWRTWQIRWQYRHLATPRVRKPVAAPQVSADERP